MKKCSTVMLVVVLLVGTALARKKTPFKSVALNPRVPYQALTQVRHRAMKFLKRSQNKDGSWGRGGHAFQATAFSLSAFLHSGEGSVSHTYGDTIRNAHDWLLSAKPGSLNDKLALVMALSNYYTVHKTDSTANKVSKMLSSIGSKPSEIWQDLLAATRLCDEEKRPEWAMHGKQLLKKYLAKTNKFEMASLGDYLELYMISRAKLHNDKNYYISYRQTVLRRQAEDGCFPARVKGDRFAATALVVMIEAKQLCGAPSFFPHADKESSKNNTEIIVDVTK